MKNNEREEEGLYSNLAEADNIKQLNKLQQLNWSFDYCSCVRNFKWQCHSSASSELPRALIFLRPAGIETNHWAQLSVRRIPYG